MALGAAGIGPAAEDLRRKDFVGCIDLTDAQVTSSKSMQDFVAACKKTAPLNAFLAEALDMQR